MLSLRHWSLILPALSLVSCAATSDPSAGGLTGFRDGLFRQRTQEKLALIRSTSGDTARQRTEAVNLGHEIERLRQQQSKAASLGQQTQAPR